MNTNMSITTATTMSTTIEGMPQQPQAQLLPLLYLASPSLPIGAFAYSGGLESAIELGWVSDESCLIEWCAGVIDQALGRLDVPVLLRLQRAWQEGDQEAVSRWNAFVRANRETRELLFEDEQLGAAMIRLLQGLGRLPAWLPPQPGYLTLYAATSVSFGIEPGQAALTWLWSYLENQVAVASKTIPLGQSKAQQVLMALMPQLAPVVERAGQLADDELGVTLPGLAQASAWHETQYSRLFRS